MLAALSTELDLNIEQIDVTTAYLNGDIDAEIYMDKPDLLEDMLRRITTEEKDADIINKAKTMLSDLKGGNKVCRLNKALYGLRQVGKLWHSKIHDTLCKIGLTPTSADPCVFFSKSNDKLTLVLLYVDDMLIAFSDQKETRRIKSELAKRFDIKELGPAKYCLGIEVRKNKKTLTLSQSSYIKNILRKFGMTDCKTARTPMALKGSESLNEEITCSSEEKYPFKELLGSLMYLAVCTRPDIAYSVNYLSQFNNCFQKEHWIAAKRILRYLKGTMNHGLVYRKTNKPLTCYVDADWANDRTDRKSYTGSVYMLANAAITWESRKQRSVALSSTEAEYMSLTDAAKEGIHLLRFLKELGLGNLASIQMFNDNQAAGKLAHNPVFHARSKHIDVRFHFIREVLKNQPIKLEYLPTELMIADVLTKGLPHLKHERFKEGLGIADTGSHCSD